MVYNQRTARIINNKPHLVMIPIFMTLFWVIILYIEIFVVVKTRYISKIDTSAIKKFELQVIAKYRKPLAKTQSNDTKNTISE